MKKVKNLGNGLYQNVITLGKSYKFPGFSLEHFKSTGLLQQLAKDLPEEVGYNFWNIGKKVDLNMVKQMLDKLEIIVLDKFDVYAQITGVRFETEQIIKWFNNYKTHILSLFDNLSAEENYFAFFLPSNVLGIANNYRIYPDYSPFLPDYIEYLDGELETQIMNIFKEDKNMKFEYAHPAIFPQIIKQESIERYFLKYINNVDKAELDNTIKSLFFKFLEEEVKPSMLRLRKYKEEQGMSEEDLKKQILKLLNGFTNFDTLGEDMYSGEEYQPSARGGYFFYSSFSTFLKLADLTFIGGMFGDSFKNTVGIKLVKEILKKELKEGNIDYYVIKMFMKKEKATYQFANHPFDERYIYLANGTKIPINEDLYEIMKQQEKNTVKRLYGFTIGIYGPNKEKLDEVYRKLVRRLNQEGIKVQLNFHEGYNVFEDYNNRLSIGGPQTKACNKANFLPLFSVARTIPKVYPLRMVSYFGLDTGSDTPVFLDPFQDLDANKNMVVVGSSGSGKTVFAQQFLQTLTTDKVFAIDPVGTFAKLGKFPELGVKVFNMLNLDYNPIAIDKKFYKEIGYPLNLVITDKVDLLIDILNIKADKENALNRQDFVKVILYYFFENNDTVKLKDIGKFFKSIIQTKNWKELDKDFLLYLDTKNIILTDETFEIYKKKITALNFTINSIENSIIGIAMNEKDKDIIPDMFKERFIIFDIAGLKLTDKTIDQISPFDMALFLFLLYSFSLYTNFYKYLFEKNVDVYQNDLNKLVNNYIVIDEAHILLNDERLLKKLDKDIRTVRNRRTSIVLLTQSIEDILKMGSEILPNISVKMFFKQEDIKIYKDYLLGKVDEDSNLPEYVENTLLYINHFIDLLRSNVDKSKRYAFIEYGGEFFITFIKLTGKMLEIIGKKKKSE